MPRAAKEPTARKSDAETVTRYDIVADPDQQKDLTAAQPERVKEMLKALAEWRESVKASFSGKDNMATKP